MQPSSLGGLQANCHQHLQQAQGVVVCVLMCIGVCWCSCCCTLLWLYCIVHMLVYILLTCIYPHQHITYAHTSHTHTRIHTNTHQYTPIHTHTHTHQHTHINTHNNTHSWLGGAAAKAVSNDQKPKRAEIAKATGDGLANLFRAMEEVWVGGWVCSNGDV